MATKRQRPAPFYVTYEEGNRAPTLSFPTAEDAHSFGSAHRPSIVGERANIRYGRHAEFVWDDNTIAYYPSDEN